MESAINRINRHKKIRRILLLAVPVLFIFLFISAIQWFLYFLVIAVILVLVFFKKDLYFFLALVIPSLSLGSIIGLEIRPNWTYEISIGEILLIVVFLAYITDYFINREKKLKFDDIMVWLLFYTALGLGSMFWVDSFTNFFGIIKVIIFSCIAYFLGFNLINKGKKFEIMAYGMLTAIFILGVQVFNKFYTLGMSPRFFFDRSSISIPIGAIALTSAILAFMLPVAFAFAFRVKGVGKVLSFGAIAIGLLAILLSMGKGAIASVMIGLGYFFLRNKENRKYFIGGFIIFIAVIYVFFASYLNALFVRIANIFIDSNSKFRLQEYRVGLELIKNHLLFGAGIGQQQVLYREYIHPDYNQLVNNFILQSTIDLGVAGLTIVMAIIGKIFVNSMKFIKFLKDSDKVMAYGFTASLLAAFFNSMVEVTIFTLPYAIIFWTVTGSYFGIMHGYVEKRDGLNPDAYQNI